MWFRRKRKLKISLLVPYRRETGSPHREALWAWLKAYWKYELPEAEIVVGSDRKGRGKPFSKSAAINDAFKRSRGDVVVILDADTYISGDVIRHCADRIRSARSIGIRTWFVPYRHIYRLTLEATSKVLGSSPCYPTRFPSPPLANDIEDMSGSAFGHKYGALIQILPREAFDTVGCMDTRFRGWGGEDVSFLRALDTLWAQHKNMPGDVLHLWHPKLHQGSVPSTGGSWKVRLWQGQNEPNANAWLSIKYNDATGRPSEMRPLVDAGCKGVRLTRIKLAVASTLIISIVSLLLYLR